MHRLPLLLATLIVSASALAQPTPGALALFDSFTGAQSGVSVAVRTPEQPHDGGWRVEGPGPAPFTQAGRLFFPAGAASAAAVIAAPPGDRTVHTTVYQPAGHTASVVSRLYIRYRDVQNHLALVVAWPASSGNVGVPAPSATVSLVLTENGQQAQSDVVGTVTHTVYDRDLPLVVQTAGDGVTVWIDGLRTGTAASTALADAPSIAFSAETPPRLNGGTYAQLTDIVVTTPASPQSSVCPALTGYAAQACVRAQFSPLRTYDYDEARDRLYQTIAAQGSGAQPRTVEGVYGGGTAEWRPDYGLSPRRQIQDDGFNAEHVWPQSRGADQSPASRTDLHALAPAFGTFNSARSNRAYGDAFFPDETAKWLRGRSVRYASSGPPSSSLSTYSRVERDFTRTPDDSDDFVSLAEQGRFDVRAARRGDVARQAAYFLALYRIEAEDGDEGRAFIAATLETLLAWHEADPVDAAEQARLDRTFLAQGNRNPFALDPTLLRRAFYDGDAAPAVASVWINEVHHTNAGPDTGEGVEIAGPAGTDLYGYRIWPYSGSGSLYSVSSRSGDGPSVSFRETIDDEGGGMGAVWAAAERLRSGCQGLALTDPAGRIVEFLSTGGCQFNALSGPVFDLAERRGAGLPAHPDSLVWSTGIAGPRSTSGVRRRVQEWTTMPAGYSLQRSGAGRSAADFYWAGPLPTSPGRLNDYQAPARGANRVSGWTRGLPSPSGLDAPLADDGRDEDAPRPAEARTASPTETLDLGPPAPNPARGTVRFLLSAPPSARLDAVVVDALGRTVLRLSPTPGAVSLDASRLAPGVYVLRVASSTHGAVSRRFTIVP